MSGMDKEVKPWSCAICVHLQKEVYQEQNGAKLYQCTNQKRNGNVVGWCREERELKYQGCSLCNELYPGDMFDVLSKFSDKHKRYLYCGKERNKRVLLSIPYHVYSSVPSDYFRSQTGKIKTNIKMVKQTKEQIEFHKRVAKRVMRK